MYGNKFDAQQEPGGTLAGQALNSACPPVQTVRHTLYGRRAYLARELDNVLTALVFTPDSVMDMDIRDFRKLANLL